MLLTTVLITFTRWNFLDPYISQCQYTESPMWPVKWNMWLPFHQSLLIHVRRGLNVPGIHHTSAPNPPPPPHPPFNSGSGCGGERWYWKNWISMRGSYNQWARLNKAHGHWHGSNFQSSKIYVVSTFARTSCKKRIHTANFSHLDNYCLCYIFFECLCVL